MTMKILSWNVNGIRAAERKGFITWLTKAKPDILCIQETKAHRSQLSDELLNINGYHSFFEAATIKKGYSGVAIYTRKEPISVKPGMGIKKFDEEGRMLTADYGKFVLINCYFPNGGQGEHRIKYKLEFYAAFHTYINKLRKAKKNVIWTGDVNTAHNEIDLARPKANEKNTGFLPIERAWLDKVTNDNWIDTFRHFHPNTKDAYSYWDQKTQARDRNVGWRIDYFFVDKKFISKVKDARIYPDVMGSDHCPVGINLK